MRQVIAREMSRTSTSQPPLRIGPLTVQGRAFLAPMSGVTDTPFRLLAHSLGAGLVVSEMVASSELAKGRPKAVRKAQRGAVKPFVMQLVGRETHWMGEGARIAEGLGADVIDINMGCPAREVTGMLSGSALMRDLDHAQRLIEAVVAATSRPVTLKMRLGWDAASLNAPELARRAEQAGVVLITVHGRTRCQFYKGRANWSAVRAVRDASRLPLVVNGDIVDPVSARTALAASGADAVMIGRGAYGAPWMPGRIGTALATGVDPGDPGPDVRGDLLCELIVAMSALHGREHGLKQARKHIAWTLDRSTLGPERQRAWRARLCQLDDVDVVLRGVREAMAEALDAQGALAA